MTGMPLGDDRQSLRRSLQLLGGIRPARMVMVFWVVASCAIVAATAVALWKLRAQALERAERETANLVRLLSEQTARAVHAVDATLLGTADRLRTNRTTGFLMDTRAIHTLLRARIDGMPQVRSLSVFGPEGMLLRTSLAYPTPEMSAADRDYFAVHRADAERGLFIDRPFRSRLDGKWVVMTSRRLDGLGADFDGVIAAALDPAYFEELYRAIELGEGGVICLFERDGTLLASWPRKEASVGQSFADSLIFRALGAEDAEAPRLLEDAGEITAFGEAGRLPLVVAVTMTKDTVLAPWRRQAWLASLIAAGVVLLLGLAALALRRELAWEEALTEELRGSQRQLRELAAALDDVREAEQMRIARELHDELGQHLTGLKMDLAWISSKLPENRPELLNKAEGMKKLVDIAVKSVRRIASELRPLVLDDLGLVAGLEWLVQDFSKRTGIEATLNLDLGSMAPSDAQASALFRILQESLTNVARHAEASRVHVALVHDGGRLVLSVQDDGKGFATGAAAGKSGSFGLIGIRERAIMHGGKASLSSRPGEGTRLEVSIPIPCPGEAQR